MYRGSAEPCPACEGTLEMLHAMVPVSGCRTCGGVWLGPDATMHVLQGLGDEVETEVAALSVDSARRSLHPAGPDSGARGCPTCGLIMQRLPVSSTMIDSCPTHGTFFDRDEVVHVVRACRRLRAHPDPTSLRNRVAAAIEAWLQR